MARNELPARMARNEQFSGVARDELIAKITNIERLDTLARIWLSTRQPGLT